MIAKFTFNYNGGFEKKENAVFQQGSIGVDSYQVFAPFLTTTQVYIKTKRNGDLEFSLWKQLDYNSTIGGWLKTATQDELLVDGEMKVVFKFNNLVSQETSLWVRKGTLIVPEMTTYEALRDYVENQEIRIDQIINGTTDIAFDKTGTNLNSDFVEEAIKEVNDKSDANKQDIIDMKDGTDAFSEITLGTPPNIVTIRYIHTNGNNYQVVGITYPDGRESNINEEMYVNFRNESGATRSSGLFLMTDGISQGNQAVKGILFNPTSQHARKFLGVTTVENVAVNAKSKVTRFGIVHGIPTTRFRVTGTAYAEGQYLWATADGLLSNVAPAKPALQINVGIIINLQGGNADILVCPIVYGAFGDSSDVIITTPTNGDVAILGSDGIWRNSQRLVTAESEITKIKDGTTIVKKAEQDKNGNDIVNTYETKIDATSKLATKVDKTQKIIGIDLQDDILLTEFKTALGNATQSVAGLLSAEDKTHLDNLVALLESSDGDTIVDTIGEILAIFNNYPEGADLVTALNGKVDKVAGKGLSQNDFTDALKNKLDGLLNGSQYYDKTYIDALKDLNGWSSSLITTTPLAPNGTIPVASLLEYDKIRLIMSITSGASTIVQTETYDTSLGFPNGLTIMFDNVVNRRVEIQGTNAVYIDGGATPGVLYIFGDKYTELKASDTTYDNTSSEMTATTVQGAIDEVEARVDTLETFKNTTVPATYETKADVTIKLEKKANRYIDTPIAELNNHTLREVFEGGNLIVNSSLSTITDWSSHNGTLALSNGELTVTGDGLLTNMRIINSYDSIVGDKYYGRVEVKVTYNTNAQVYWNEPFYDPSFFTVPTINTFTVHSFVGNAVYSRWFYQQNFTSTTLQGANSFTIRKPYHISMTSLGISSLTQAQMDYWFNVYQQYKDDNGLKSTVDSLQALKEKDSEIELKVTTIEEAYRKSQNGELTATKQDIENISLGKDVAPAPLQVKVDGGLLGAKQLVPNGDFSNGTTGFVAGSNIQSMTAGNGVLTYVSQATGDSFTSDNDRIYVEFTAVPTSTKLYININAKYEGSSGGIRIGLNPTNEDILLGGATSYQALTASFSNYSNVITTSFTRSRIRFGSGANQTILLNYLFLFNISTLIANKTYSPLYNKTFDLMSDAEIKAQMDLWVQNGTLPNNNVLAVGMNKRVRSVGKNLFDKSADIKYDYVLVNGELSPSGAGNDTYNDFISVKPSTTYILSGTSVLNRIAYYDSSQTFISLYIGNTFTTPSNASYIKLYGVGLGDELNTLQLELGPTVTSYVPYANTDLYLQANKVGYKLPNGVADTVEYRNGKYYYVQRVQKYVLQSADIVNIANSTNVAWAYTNVTPLTGIKDLSTNVTGNVYVVSKPETTFALADDVSKIGQVFVFDTTIDRLYFILPFGTTLAQAQTALSGTVVYYQLATPIETEILSLGNAQGLAGGTVYIDDVMADSNLYTSKYDIENTAYPIKSLDRIVKINADGSQTELAVSSATIAGDGLSFTHPSLVANDIVWVSYAYNVANLFKSNTFVTYYDNPFIAVQPNGTPRRITFSVDNSGVVTVSSVAV